MGRPKAHHPFNARSVNAVPTLQVALTMRPVAVPEGFQPPPPGSPLSGKTTNQATRVGPIAPKIKDKSQYPAPPGKLRLTRAKRIPQTPPQKARDQI